MATTKPRISVTVPNHVHDTIRRLAELQGRSMSAVVADILDSIHPPLMRTVALLEAARDAPAQVKEGLRRTIEDMEREMVSASGAGVAQMDWLLGKITEGGAGAAASRPAPPDTLGEGSNPRIVTRGSGRKTRTRKGGE